MFPLNDNCSGIDKFRFDSILAEFVGNFHLRIDILYGLINHYNTVRFLFIYIYKNIHELTSPRNCTIKTIQEFAKTDLNDSATDAFVACFLVSINLLMLKKLIPNIKEYVLLTIYLNSIKMFYS